MNSIRKPSIEETRRIIDIALAEDLGADGAPGDITSRAVVAENLQAKAVLVADAEGIIAGLEVFHQVFLALGSLEKFKLHFTDGDCVKQHDIIAELQGNARHLLIAERTALNFLCHLSGIATITNRYVRAVQDLGAKILDTRKTLPAFRSLEKYAVAVGGGTNHRFGLYDAFLIKENHIAMGGGVRKTIAAARKFSLLPVQIEVEDIDQLMEAIEAGADSVLLDNMTPQQTREAVLLARKLAKPDFLLESSGGINLENVHAYAKTGVDRISIGALTHSVKALDLSLEISLLT